MRVLIVDDETAARTRLARLCRDLGVDVVAEAPDGLAALALASSLRPDVVLLDIEMPEVSGLDVARRLGDAGPLVVFQTAYDEYALAAFEREALDFIVKPVTPERLSQSFERARRRLAERSGVSVMTEAMAARLEAVVGRGRRPVPRRILVRHHGGHRLIPVATIDRFAAADGVVCAFVGGTEHLTDDSLDALESRLSPVFVRTTRSDLIAIDRVDRITSNGDGSAVLILKDGSRWRVSRRRASAVRESLQR